ncbi:LOW QUALITY PROTEIN: protein KRBA1 [Tachyglossus aculeatus]|uniref:LOW QUALITY PROTEIN: protein KRBA1 n=1 Tax=Tachyglossus aculeatus TaxID=9261 RepID=UPI0018F2A0D5|nr:LOW QUALITY PROTEIN: protein KRBA1 [Tachyglossus aculeatus]
MARRVPVTFEDLAVRFSVDEWALLEEWQRTFHRDVMRENFELLVSLGQPLSPSVFLSLTEPWEANRGKGCLRPGVAERLGEDCGAPGEWQGSLHLSALVRLVKTIPEFLFGETKAPTETAERGPAGAEPLELLRPGGDAGPMESCLQEVPGHPAISAGHLPAQGHGELKNPEPQPGNPLRAGPMGGPCPRPSLGGGKEAPESAPGQLGTSACGQSPGGIAGGRGRPDSDSGSMGPEVSPGSSPLEGLLNCLKEILVHRPQPSPPAAHRISPHGALGAREPPRLDRRGGVPSWEVKAGGSPPARTSPLQDLLNHLRDIPETRPRSPSPAPAPSSAGPQATSGPSRRAEPGPWNWAFRVKTEVVAEDARVPGPQSHVPDRPVPAARPPGPSSASSPRYSGDHRGPEMLCWAPTAPVGSAHGSPLEALEACLKEIPGSRTQPAQAPTGPWRLSHGELEAQRWKGEEVPSGLGFRQGLRGWGKELTACRWTHPSTPTSVSSTSSTDGDLDIRGPEGKWGREMAAALTVAAETESSPLRGLENCLREISVRRPPNGQPPWALPGDGAHRRGEPGRWRPPDRGGLRSEAPDPHRPSRGSKEAAGRAARLPGTSTHPWRGAGDLWLAEGALWRGPWEGEFKGTVAGPSPLRGLENCLRGISAMRPPHFTSAAGPGPSPSPSLSASSSSGGSDGEDRRPEPAARLAPPHKGSPLSSPERGRQDPPAPWPHPPGIFHSVGSSGRDVGSKKPKMEAQGTLVAAVKIEEGTGDSPRSNPPPQEKEASTERPCPCDTPSSPGGGASTESCTSLGPMDPGPGPGTPSPGGAKGVGGSEALEAGILKPSETKALGTSSPPSGPGGCLRDSPSGGPAPTSTLVSPSTLTVTSKSPVCTPEGMARGGLEPDGSAQLEEGTASPGPEELPTVKPQNSPGGSSGTPDISASPRPGQGTKRSYSQAEMGIGPLCSRTPCSGSPSSEPPCHKPPRSAGPSWTPPAETPGQTAHPSSPQPRPPCPCGEALREDLRGLGATLSQQLGQIAAALAGLSRDFAAVRSHVDRLERGPRRRRRPPTLSWSRRWGKGTLRRRPRRPGPKGPPLGEQPKRAEEGSGVGRPQGPLPGPPPAAPNEASSPVLPAPAPSSSGCYPPLNGRLPCGRPEGCLGPLPTPAPASPSPRTALPPQPGGGAEPPPGAAVPLVVPGEQRDAGSPALAAGGAPQGPDWACGDGHPVWGAAWVDRGEPVG